MEPLPRGAQFIRSKMLWEIALGLAGDTSIPYYGNRDVAIVVGNGSGEAFTRAVSMAPGSPILSHAVARGELDMAFVSLPVQAKNIETELLSQDQLVAVASPRHPLAKQKVVSAFALAGEKLILGERGGNTRRLIDEVFAEAGLKPSVTMELSRQSAIKNMVAAGMGVGIVPLSTAREDVERGRLVRWWIEGARINWELGVARLSGGYLSPVCQSFVELCHEYFKAKAGADDGAPKHPKKRTARGKKQRAAKASGRGGRKKASSRA